MSPEEELEIISAVVYEKVGNKELNRMLLYYLFAREFGWTPDQVDELDLRTVMFLKRIIEVVSKEEELAMRRGGRRGNRRFV